MCLYFTCAYNLQKPVLIFKLNQLEINFFSFYKFEIGETVNCEFTYYKKTFTLKCKALSQDFIDGKPGFVSNQEQTNSSKYRLTAHTARLSILQRPLLTFDVD